MKHAILETALDQGRQRAAWRLFATYQDGRPDTFTLGWAMVLTFQSLAG